MMMMIMMMIIPIHVFSLIIEFCQQNKYQYATVYSNKNYNNGKNYHEVVAVPFLAASSDSWFFFSLTRRSFSLIRPSDGDDDDVVDGDEHHDVKDTCY